MLNESQKNEFWDTALETIKNISPVDIPDKPKNSKALSNFFSAYRMRGLPLIAFLELSIAQNENVITVLNKLNLRYRIKWEVIMKVNLKCFANLADEDSCDYKGSTPYDLPDGQTVHDLIKHAGLDHEDVKVAFVNSRKVELDTVLSDGDQVGLAPAIGGM
jgi:sulfur carrier protein ThiS